MCPEKQSLFMRLLRNLILIGIAAGALAGGLCLAWYFMTNKPQPQRRRPPEAAALAEAQVVRPGTYRVTIPALGTVIPAVEVRLQPRVNGEVLEIHPHFLEGGLVSKGDVLVRLDPADYELAVIQQKARLENARYQLIAEEAQQDVAEQEWDLFDFKQDASELDRELALRQPQLRNAEAALKAEEARLRQAELNLERTTLKAPCNAVIQSAMVDVGDIAGTQTVLAEIVGTDTYRVQVSIPKDELAWLELPASPESPSPEARIYTDRGVERRGRILSLLSDIGEEARMARLLLEVKDPRCLGGTGDCQALLLGEYVRVEMAGRAVDEVAALPRNALRNGREVWVITPENTLAMLPAEAVWTDENVALLRGLDDGTRVIVSDLAAPVEGMAVQTEEAAANSGGDAAPGEDQPGARS
jgi:RND family efflux transporter MFP subunit